MQLQDILNQHDFHLANESHDSELQEIFEEIPMRVGNILFSTQRRPSYFSFTNLRSEKHYTFFTRDSVTQRIASVGCLSLRKGYIGGEAQTIGFFGDMRSHFSRETSRKWRAFYGDLIQSGPECADLLKCRHFYTTILQPNRRALQAYVRQGRNPFRYDPLPDCDIINIYGRLRPSLPREARDKWSVRTAVSQDRKAIEKFLDQENRKRIFGFCFEEELNHRFKSWKNFNIERFFIVEDRKANIVAVTAPWSPGEAQQIVAESLPKPARVASWFTHRLPLRKWLRMAHEGEAIEPLYLTHFHVASDHNQTDRCQIASRLLDCIYDYYVDEDWQVMSLPTFARDQLGEALEGYLFHRIPLKVFSVHTPGGDLKHSTSDFETALPGVEVALI